MKIKLFFALVFCSTLLNAQWIIVPDIQPTFWTVDYTYYGKDGDKIYHYKLNNNTVNVYDNAYALDYSYSLSKFDITQTGQIQVFNSDTLYVYARYTDQTRGLALIYNNGNSILKLDTINNDVVRGNILDCYFFDASQGVIRTAASNYLTRDGGQTWEKRDTSMYKFTNYNKTFERYRATSLSHKSGFISNVSSDQGKRYLIYSTDYLQNIEEKELPLSFNYPVHMALSDPAHHIYVQSINPSLSTLHYTSDTGNTFYRIDTINAEVSRILYQRPNDYAGFYTILTNNGVYYLDERDSSWRKLNDINAEYLTFYSKSKAFAYATSGEKGLYYYTGTLGLFTRSVANKPLQMWPNPTESKINIPAFIKKVTIYNVSGIKVSETDLIDLTTELDMSVYDKGLYFLTLIDKQGNTYNEKVWLK